MQKRSYVPDYKVRNRAQEECNDGILVSIAAGIYNNNHHICTQSWTYTIL